MSARTVFVGLWLTVTLTCWAVATPLFADNTGVVVAVESIRMTVSDIDRSVAFYSDVLAFKPISDVEVDGPEYDQLWGIFGVRARVVRMQLGEQILELTQFLAPPDVRPIPVPSYSNDLSRSRWTRHTDRIAMSTSPHYSRGFVTKPPRRQARRARGAVREGGILETVC